MKNHNSEMYTESQSWDLPDHLTLAAQNAPPPISILRWQVDENEDTKEVAQSRGSL